MNSVHLDVAVKKLKCFPLMTEHGKGRQCRFLPYVETLCRNPDPERALELSFLSELENMPDNTQQQTNICVKGLDASLTEDDLHLMFRGFGEIRSAKIAKDPGTSKSLGYGFIWFEEEASCLRAIEASDCGKIGYQCETYLNAALRNGSQQFSMKDCNTVTVSNFPAHFSEKELRNLFESSLLHGSTSRKALSPLDLINQRTVVGCVIIPAKLASNNENVYPPIPVEKARAEVTFSDQELTKQALLLNGVYVASGNKL